MSLHLPAKRALQAVASTSTRPQATAALCEAMHCLSIARRPASITIQKNQSRLIFNWLGKKSKRSNDELSLAKEAINNQEADIAMVREKMVSTKIHGSIFNEELGDDPSAEGPLSATRSAGKLRGGGVRSPDVIARAIDPDPRSRERWQRKMVARMVARRLDPWDRETRAERIARTERRLVHRGDIFYTSTKKLVHLARQIAGKTLDEAAVQMRFSKKKFAQNIGFHLASARDEAAVVAGMGLSRSQNGGEGSNVEAFVPVRIQTKDGKWITVDDPARLYIEQAWVNRGPFLRRGLHYAGRGRAHSKFTRTSNITFVVKEEKTRLREHAEREAKKALRKPWIHLPNRPVTAQRQHYSW